MEFFYKMEFPASPSWDVRHKEVGRKKRELEGAGMTIHEGA